MLLLCCFAIDRPAYERAEAASSPHVLAVVLCLLHPAAEGFGQHQQIQI
jgi:hypothetical protein